MSRLASDVSLAVKYFDHSRGILMAKTKEGRCPGNGCQDDDLVRVRRWDKAGYQYTMTRCGDHLARWLKAIGYVWFPEFREVSARKGEKIYQRVRERV